ncbi:MAG TPA: hypothetical protein VNU26_00545 [Mycobacteriales bacterium]|nr:hypothetical protein [Mycobacteriales bacterium]
MMDRSTISDTGDLRLAAMQLAAIDTWHRTRRLAERAAAAAAASREMRMDVDRRMEVLRAQHEAIVRRTEASLSESVRLLQSVSSRRAVVAHRNAWFADKLCCDLEQRGIQVLGRFENGAEVVGVVVAEQPDLVLVEEKLAMVPGDEVVRDLRRFAPETVVAAQVAFDDGIDRMLEAGAVAAYVRRIPPLDVSADLVRLLDEARQPA